MTGVKFLLRVTLRRHDLAAEVYHLKEPQKVPQVLSPDERVACCRCHQPQGARHVRSAMVAACVQAKWCG